MSVEISFTTALLKRWIFEMMHGNTLQHAATTHCCNTLLQHTAIHCTVEEVDTSDDAMQHTATHCCNKLQHNVAAHCNNQCINLFRWNLLSNCCNTLQHPATHCNTLQHAATHRNTLQHTTTHCNALQHTATHCNTLQHTTTHSNVSQHAAPHLRVMSRIQKIECKTRVCSCCVFQHTHTSHDEYGVAAISRLL